MILIKSTTTIGKWSDYTYMVLGQNRKTHLPNGYIRYLKTAGYWMFIPKNMVIIGFDPSPYSYTYTYTYTFTFTYTYILLYTYIYIQFYIYICNYTYYVFIYLLIYLIYLWVPKMVVPLNHPFNRVAHYKSTILGYPHSWKPPYIYIYCLSCLRWKNGSRSCWSGCILAWPCMVTCYHSTLVGQI